MSQNTIPERFFFKGGENVIQENDGSLLDDSASTKRIREHLTEALNARYVSILLGSGCSSYRSEGRETGIPTMGPLAKKFLRRTGSGRNARFPTAREKEKLRTRFGIDLEADEFKRNLERLMETLYALAAVLQHSGRNVHQDSLRVVISVIRKVKRHIFESCNPHRLIEDDSELLNLYRAFYQKLIYRDRSLPRPWIFTTNYDVLNELALDSLGIPYCNGFAGTVERRFNPALYRYALAEQLDISQSRWSALDNYVYLCKLHGSISWKRDGEGLFPVREYQQIDDADLDGLMIYPTPSKQSISFGAPYSDLFRQFYNAMVKEQSVLFTVGYSFSDEHVNNIIFQALTIPTFRLIALVPKITSENISRLFDLNDPRIWLIGGIAESTRFHHFNTFVESFLPEMPGVSVDESIKQVISKLIESDQSS